MNMVLNILVGVQMLTALAMIGLILVQHGKGADMGAAFGSGSAGSLFGASGSANFLSRTTAVLAAVFFVSTLALAYFATNRPRASGGVMQNLPAQTAPAVPSDPALNAVPKTDAPATGATPAPTINPGANKPSDIPK